VTPPREVQFSVYGIPRPKGSTKAHFDPSRQRIITRPASDSLKACKPEVN
jgi:hypothetical protein